MTNEEWNEALDRFNVDTEGGRSWNVMVKLADESQVRFTLLEREPYEVDGVFFVRKADTDLEGRRIEVREVVELLAAIRH